MRDGAVSGLRDNAAFLPSPEARPALVPFAGTLVIAAQAMAAAPGFPAPRLLERELGLFPAARLGFFTCGEDLVPVTQEVLRHGSTAAGTSYWDLLVQAGRVWSEPGEAGWSRASFPFALMHSLEGETHNGVALFRYREGEVAGLRFQIVQQTAPFLVTRPFTAAGRLEVSYDPAVAGDPAALAERHRCALADALPVAPWSALEARVGAERLAGFDSAVRPEELVLDGLYVDGTFYLKSCPSAGGDLPYWERQRFGVWSVTKAATNATALLRLAQKYGPEVAALKLADFLPEAGAAPALREASFGDALDMATGLCNPATDLDAETAVERATSAAYADWYVAPTTADKLRATFRDGAAGPWGPGSVTRYRDEDMFLLGVAMQRFLQAREGAGASPWRMLEEEVYRPLGIHAAPTNRTLEADQVEAQPLMAYGYYPTVGDLVKIACLFQNGGRWGGRQILSEALLADILPGPAPRGLPTGDAFLPFYRKAFWHGRYESRQGGDVFFPTMLGWGGNVVALFPGGIVAVRLARNLDGDASAGDLSSLAAVADRLAGPRD